MAQVEHPSGALRTGSIADELAHPPGTLNVTVVSPAAAIYEGPARWVTARAWDGQMGIWPGHTDIVSALGVGQVRIGHADGTVDRFAVWGGFLKVGGTGVTILVDRAIARDDVVEEAAKKELDETLLALRHPGTDEEFAELLDRRRWCQTQLALVR